MTDDTTPIKTAAFYLDRSIDAAWTPSLAPWRANHIDLKASAGETIEIPAELAFAAAHDIETSWGYVLTWVNSPTPQELALQREMAERHSPGPLGPSITLSRHFHPSQNQVTENPLPPAPFASALPPVTEPSPKRSPVTRRVTEPSPTERVARKASSAPPSADVRAASPASRKRTARPK